ncbi:MAG: KamA family radical SAM protein [Syntrophobacteraceae bacterium]|nr:KamA family radical SAM protein [Syntrophobacteraceae bacterium]
MLSLHDFAKKWEFDPAPLDPVAARYPFRLNPYFEGLIQSRGDAIWNQVVPDAGELSDQSGFEDPLSEERLSPAPNLVHRYPNRVLWLVNDRCALHCRFCTRKRRWTGRPAPEGPSDLKPALDYIAAREQIVDVLLSGGDPLLLAEERLHQILSKLREIKHLQIIRIGSRVPCALPGAVTPRLAAMLSSFHPLYLNIHFNHPLEITAESARACSILANAGIPLGSQTVLLRGVNDSETILAELFHKLLSIRVRPYYLMQMDLTAGTAHFRTPVSTGLRVLRLLRNRISGPAMPHFVIDLPGGRGKIPLLPNMIREINDKEMIVENYTGEFCLYPLLEGEKDALKAEMAER